MKEKLCEDEPAVKALIELGKSGDQEAAYGVVTCMVNLTNSYEKQEIMPEMLELAKFAKHHIPQEHEMDDPDFVDKRIWVSYFFSILGIYLNLFKVTNDYNFQAFFLYKIMILNFSTCVNWFFFLTAGKQRIGLSVIQKCTQSDFILKALEIF